MQIKNNKLYLGKIKAEDLIKKYGSPLYIYESEVIRKKYRELVTNINYKDVKIYYACKANINQQILKVFKKLGANIEAVSQGEVRLALKAGFKPNQIIYTCSNITDQELKFLIKNKITINLDSLNQFKKYGELNPNSSVSIRINQGIGAGHHQHVITGGPKSKFGIYFSRIEEVKKIAKQYNLNIAGIHHHIGSGILNEKIFIKAMKALLKTARKFEHLEFIDFGGGFGIPYKPNQKNLAMKKLGREISQLFNDFCKFYGRKLTMIFEPGSYLIAEAGTLLTTVTDIKETPFKTFVGVDSGFNHLIRPIMYGAYHPILNASQIKGRKETVSIAGNICESGDLFAKNIKITKFKIGDILAILNTGAYGFSMSSDYNSRLSPAEIIISQGQAKIIRKRGNY
ncbi:diaminopimelate decarboxylase [Patescibacteria group bacterium]|nr:diaminopimelate decarboxylase [Patescibacteria group bacterium]